MSNTESSLEGMSVMSPLGVLVEVTVAGAERAAVTTAGVADVSITLVVPVVNSVVWHEWVLVAIWTPGGVVGAVDLSFVAEETADVAWLVMSVTPDGVVTGWWGWVRVSALLSVVVLNRDC